MEYQREHDAPTYTPSAAKAQGVRFRGFPLQDPAEMGTHDPRGITAVMLCVLQDQLLWLTDFVRKHDQQEFITAGEHNAYRANVAETVAGMQKEIEELKKAFDPNKGEVAKMSDLAMLSRELSRQKTKAETFDASFCAANTRLDSMVEMIRQRDEKIVSLTGFMDALQKRCNAMSEELKKLQDKKRKR